MITKEITQQVEREMLYINRIVVQPTDQTTYHSHSFVEIVYIAEGTGIHRIGNQVFHAKKGDIALINYDVPHQVSAIDETLIVYNFLFTPNYLDAALKNSRNFFDISQNFLLGNFYQSDFDRYIYVSVSGNENVHILNIYDRLLQEYERKQIGYREIMRGYLIELLITIFRLNMHERTGNSSKLLETLDYIGTHFTEDLSLDHLAAMSEYSISGFGRNFKALTGVTVTRYIQTFRIEHACKLLYETDKTVIEIANEVGYSDIKHFYSVFKKITGKLPKEFR